MLDEQLVVINDIADDLRLRSLVSETPLAAHEHSDAQRHLEAAQRAASRARRDRCGAGEAPGRATGPPDILNRLTVLSQPEHHLSGTAQEPGAGSGSVFTISTSHGA